MAPHRTDKTLEHSVGQLSSDVQRLQRQLATLQQEVAVLCLQHVHHHEQHHNGTGTYNGHFIMLCGRRSISC
jgi:hypothetical protein